MPEPSLTWDLTDAWVFAAIAVHHRRASLAQVVAAADWVNDSIVTGSELGTALGKLVGADLVRVYDDWTFELTDDGESLWTGPGRDLQRELAKVVADLSVVEPGRATVTLAPGVLDAAVKEYQEADRG